MSTPPPRYTSCISVSRIGSALLHRGNLHQTNAVDYFVYSRSHAFHGRDHTLRRTTQRIENRTLDFYPNGESRAIRPLGRGGFIYICRRMLENTDTSGKTFFNHNHTGSLNLASFALPSMSIFGPRSTSGIYSTTT